jgi:hypothetical protein
VDHPNEQDAAIKVKALSRWNNYYVEGIRQMIDDFGFDGLYVRLRLFLFYYGQIPVLLRLNK